MEVATWHTYQVDQTPGTHERAAQRHIAVPAAAEKHIWWRDLSENRRHGVPRIAQLQTLAVLVLFPVFCCLKMSATISLKGILWRIVVKKGFVPC